MTERRNLRLFYIDDRIPPVGTKYVDLVFKGLYGWQTHCRHIFANPVLEFDLLSADINFSEDDTDPAHARGENNTTWGLIHALAALARRQHHDRSRNRLPLAWELRSVSPNAYREDTEGLRAYGLLRTLAAMPREGETITDCVAREYRETYRKILNLQPPGHAGAGLKNLFTEDLAGQSSRNSDVRGVLSRLLPTWRRRFLEAVRTGMCSLGTKAASDQLEILRATNSIPATVGDGPFVPIGDSVRQLDYGIWLVSIFADKLRQDDRGKMFLPLNEQFADLAPIDDPTDPATVAEWYGFLIKLATGAEATGSPVKSFLPMVRRAYDLISKDKLEGAGTGLLNEALHPSQGEDNAIEPFDPRQRGMLLCFLTALNVLENDIPAKNLTELAKRYRIDTNERTWRDGIRQNPGWFGELDPKQIRKKIVAAMRDEPDHELGVIWDWLSEGLARWIKTLGQPGDPRKFSDWRNSIARRAHGLVQKESSLRQTLEGWK